MNISHRPIQQGFTLIETLIAILIFTAALVSLMTIAGRGISATSGARQQITAHYQAQEGIEVARNIRDSNFKSGNPWDLDLALCSAGTPCKVVYGNLTVTPKLDVCSNDCAVYQSQWAFVDAPGESRSPYVREVVATPHTNAQGTVDEYEIVSTVRWNAKGIARTVSLATVLKLWQ